MIDIHTHILPHIDDGSRSVKESVDMLRCIKQGRVDTVVATPHFYAHKEDLEIFLQRRAKSYRQLQEYLTIQGYEDIPRILLGAEVLYFPGISRSDSLEQLFIEDTNILLLEMPFKVWTREMIQEIESMYYDGSVRIMMAHLERYLRIYGNRRFIRELLELGVLIQVNTGALLNWRSRIVVEKWMKLGLVDAIGSDAHNMEERRPNWQECNSILEKYDDFMTWDRMRK